MTKGRALVRSEGRERVYKHLPRSTAYALLRTSRGRRSAANPQLTLSLSVTS